MSIFSPHLFSQYAKKTVTNTVTKTTLFGTGEGSTVLPANIFNHVGKGVMLEMMGNWSKSVVGGLTLLIEVINNGTPQEIHKKIWTNAQLGGAGSTIGHWGIHMMIVCYSTGATGSIMTHAELKLLENTSAETLGTHSETSEVTINTTLTTELLITAQWTDADANLIISSANVVITGH